MNQTEPTSYGPLILFLIAVFLTGAIFIVSLPPIEAAEPDYHTLIWHSRPDLLHLSGKYRVLIYNESGEYIGYIHLSRTEMSKPVRIYTDYQFDEFRKELSDARILSK
jgi:hypothetical protein